MEGQGYFIEFRFRIPECELRRFIVSDSPNTHWLPPPPPRMASEVTILSGPPHHAGIPPRREGEGPSELIAEFQLENRRYVWVVHQHIPSPSGAELQAVRKRARTEILRLYGNKLGEILPRTRVTATTNCGDGSFAEVELAADFLRGARRRRA